MTTPVSLNTARLQECERLVRRYEAAWQAGERPDLTAFLPDDATLRGEVLIELIHTELEYQLRAGEQPRVAEWLARFPEIAADPRLHEELQLSLQLGRQRWQRLVGQLPTSVLAAHLGKYELLERVGQGSFGSVYRAYDAELQRTVAVKVAHGELSDAIDRERFLREARSAGRLHHPHLVPIYECGQRDGRCYIVSAFIAGSPLSERMKAAPLPECLTWLHQAAEALHAAHQQGVIHRDVKPGNILIDQAGAAFVVDFGLAVRPEEAGQLTGRSELLGTAAYLPPERVRNPAIVPEPRGDVYSLGVILYEMLSGQLPFVGSPAMVLHQVLHEDVRPPRRLNPTVARDLDTICLKAMAPEPGRRYATAQEFADDLRRFLNGEPVQARPVTRGTRAVRWARRHPAIATLTALLVVVVVAGLLGVTLAWQAARREREAAQEQARRAEDRLRDSQLLLAAFVQISRSPLMQQPDVQPARLELLDRLQALFEPLASAEETHTLRHERAAVADSVQQQESTEHARRERALAFTLLGQVHRNRGAAEKAEGCYRRALELWDSLPTREPVPLPDRIGRAQACKGLGHVLSDLQRIPEARAQVQRARAEWARIVAEQPTRDADLALTECDLFLANTPTSSLPAERIRVWEVALEKVARLHEDHPDDAHIHALLAHGYNRSGSFCAQHPALFATAELHLDLAASLFRSLLARAPHNAEIRYQLGRTRELRAHVAQRQVRPGELYLHEAAREYARAGADARLLLIANPDSEREQLALGTMLMHQAQLHRRQSQWRTALTVLDEAEPRLAALTKHPFYGPTAQRWRIDAALLRWYCHCLLDELPQRERIVRAWPALWQEWVQLESADWPGHEEIIDHWLRVGMDLVDELRPAKRMKALREGYSFLLTIQGERVRQRPSDPSVLRKYAEYWFEAGHCYAELKQRQQSDTDYAQSHVQMRTVVQLSPTFDNRKFLDTILRYRVRELIPLGRFTAAADCHTERRALWSDAPDRLRRLADDWRTLAQAVETSESLEAPSKQQLTVRCRREAEAILSELNSSGR